MIVLKLEHINCMDKRDLYTKNELQKRKNRYIKYNLAEVNLKTRLLPIRDFPSGHCILLSYRRNRMQNFK